MIKKNSTITGTRTLLLAGTSALLLSACGGSDAKDEASEAVERAEESVAQASQAAQSMADKADKAAEKTADAMSGMAQSAEKAATDAQRAAEDKAQAASQAARSAASSAKETANDAAMRVSSLSESAASSATSAVAGAAATAKAAVDTATGSGTVHEIKMYNADPDNRRERMVFVPDLLVAQPGDTIRFVPSDPSHQSSSIDDMLPDGVEGWKGKINQPVEYTVSTPGIYGYKCVPHYAAGMIGMVVVQGDGMADNVDDAKGARHVGLAKKRFDAIWSRVESEYLN